jgi:hypothetical protein
MLLLPELSWYLEEFLDYHFAPRTERAERIERALRRWGREAFHALFENERRDTMELDDFGFAARTHKSVTLAEEGT